MDKNKFILVTQTVNGYHVPIYLNAGLIVQITPHQNFSDICTIDDRTYHVIDNIDKIMAQINA